MGKAILLVTLSVTIGLKADSLPLEISQPFNPNIHSRKVTKENPADNLFFVTQNLSSTPILNQNIKIVVDPRPAIEGNLDEITPLVKTCPEGYTLVKLEEGSKYECKCKKYHLFWPQDGLCYREYQQGPCPSGHRSVLIIYYRGLDVKRYFLLFCIGS